MSEPDQTRATGPNSEAQGEAPPTRLPATDTNLDSLQTRFNPEASNGPSIATRAPDDTYATVNPGASTYQGDAPADSFPGYELLETLGEGGMGTVYKARQEGLNRLVALKVILGGRRASPKDLIRFLAEAEAVASIKHPHVVQVHEYGEVDGRPFLTLEYLPGGSLAERLKTRQRLEPKEAAKLVAKLARAVQDAHDQGIVHRDLKPANVLFDAEGEPKVTDFGLAKRATGSDLTRTQAVMGTPAYMSPEQARGETKFVGPPADIYALGVILYECLAGTRPFHDEDTHLLLRKVIEDEPTRPTRHVPGIPRDLELIALKCLAKDPADRYPTADALADDLAHFTAGEAVSVRATGRVERTLQWAKRKPTQAAAYTLGLLALLLGGLGSVALWQWRAAELTREKFERFEYGRTVQVAHQAWWDGNIVAAINLLDGTRADLRGWEWRYVRQLCYPETLELKAHGKGEFGEGVTSVTWSPDGSRIATVSRDNRVRVWDARSEVEVLTLKDHSDAVTSVTWSPDGSRITTRTEGKPAMVWDSRTGAEVLTPKYHTSKVTSMHSSPDNSRIATLEFEDNNELRYVVRVRDARSGAEVSTFKQEGFPTSVLWSPDGSRIAIASYYCKVRIWDAQNGDELLTLKGDIASQSLVLWSPDGACIATASWDTKVRVWDTRSGAELLTLKGHTGWVNSVSWNRDGSRIATASEDKTARVWDARSGAEVLTLKGYTAGVNSVAWSPDGSRIATASGGTATIRDDRSEAELWTSGR